MRALPRLVWSEPRAPLRPSRGLAEWSLVGALVAIVLLEWALLPELPLASVLIAVAVLPTVRWRRTKPLSMVLIAFGGTTAVELAASATGTALPLPNTLAFLLLLPYALLRWGSGREAAIGVPIMLAAAASDPVLHSTPPGEFVGGFGVLVAVMALGLAVRFRDRARSHALEGVKMLERVRLARDLHDTVAHHVSAIAVRAQAGLATSTADPESAVDALRVIEAEASRALREMRAMVRSLRHDSVTGPAPLPGIDDLQQLASPSVGGAAVLVNVTGDVADVSPTVSAAVYRLAQESITNARRHARQATRIEVEVAADDEAVHLRVRDDGEVAHAGPSAPAGYGRIGMIERAELLGGTCRCGPDPEGGWSVDAVLPRHGAAA